MGEEKRVEIEWGGKKIYIPETKMNEWHGQSSNKDKINYINNHPRYKNPDNPEKPDPDSQSDDDFVLVHWSGNKTLLFERKQLDEWYQGSFEDHLNYIHRHPEAIIE